MTTLSANKPRVYDADGHKNTFPVIGAHTVYEGAAVGLVRASGYARRLTAVDAFAGFAEAKADNSAGAAAAINVDVIERGAIVLPVAGAVITDQVRKLPVYASDDDTFSFSPVGGVFVGFAIRFVSAGVMLVEFDASNFRDPYGNYSVRETISADKTLDAEDTGKLFWVDTDAKIITLPAIATGLDWCLIVNGGAYGTVAVNVSPNASDMILGADITGADNKDLINTKATAQRGDEVLIGGNDADGYSARFTGTWAREA